MKKKNVVTRAVFVAMLGLGIFLSQEGSKVSGSAKLIPGFDNGLYHQDSVFIEWVDDFDTSWTYYGSLYYGHKESFNQ